MRISAFVLTWPRLLGFTLDEVANASGLALRKLESGVDLTYDENIQLWEGIDRLSGDATWGVTAGSRFTLDQMGVVGPALAHCTHLDAAIDVLVQLMKHFAPHAPIRRVDTNEASGIEYCMPALRARHGADTLFAATVALVRHCTGKHVVPYAFEHQMGPANVDRYRAWFGVTPRWHQPASQLLFAREDLSLPFRGASPPLASLLAEQAPRLLAAEPTGPDLALEEAFWRAHLAGSASLASVAEELDVSARTLQRTLAARGETFSDLRARLLRERAQVLLADPSISIETVAERLGFSSRNAFSRAFVRWTGTTPRGKQPDRG